MVQQIFVSLHYFHMAECGAALSRFKDLLAVEVLWDCLYVFLIALQDRDTIQNQSEENKGTNMFSNFRGEQGDEKCRNIEMKKTG